MNSLQKLQLELDNYIIKKLDIKLSDQELLKNMILALHDEIREVEDDLENPSEWIDCLHFVLSIANKTGINLPENLHLPKWAVTKQDLSMLANGLLTDLRLFTRMSKTFKHWSVKPVTDEDKSDMHMYLTEMFYDIKDACDILGVDMNLEYLKKYDENIARQESGKY